VIEHYAVERFRSRSKPAGGAAVAVARPGVAARMIVGEHDPGAAMRHGIGDDLAKREERPGFVAVMTREMKTASLVIDMGDPQAFAVCVGIADAPLEKCACRGCSVQS